MTLFWVGLIVGLTAAWPLAVLASRRTERRVRRLEQRARSIERLAELGKLTGGLAHEIKNPLSTVGLNLQLLREDLQQLATEAPEESELRERLGRMLRRFETLGKETNRLREILEDFLRFAGRVKLDLQKVDLNSLVEELVDFFEPQATAAEVRLRTQLAARPAMAKVDAGLLKQAILNLLINATQAMAEARHAGTPSGGNRDLIIRTQSVRAMGQDEIHVHVTDTGPGIPAGQLEEIFTPYFTSKKGGTGLGLPTARRIVEEHGGSLTVHSEVGRGSDFLMILRAG